jgi:GTP cyclohydrolase IA
VKDALFPEAGNGHINGHTGGACGMVVVRDLDLFSYCESCLLPFSIRCHVSYLPSSNRVVGLSKLSRVADAFAKRLQSPQKLAEEVCAALNASIKPAGVAVVLQCWHVPFPENLILSSDWIRVCSSAQSGAFDGDNGSLWNDFCALLKLKGVNGIECSNSVQNWCPSLKSTANGKNMSHGKSYNSMVSAVVSVLRAIGEDPLRKELVSTPDRYVQWLMRFKTSETPDFKTILNLNATEKWKNGLVTANGHGSKICYELSLPFCSQCEHHLIPFYGSVHVGWFGNGEQEIDRAHLLALVRFYACKLQVQERMTRQIAEAVHAWCDNGVAVVVEANHICMISRGIEKVRSSTATISVLGKFATDSSAKALFLQSISDCTG